MEKREVIIVGGGPAGMAAAVKLSDLAFRDVLILEKEERTGGVLRQCIHPGFGLIKFGKNYTGPEYGRIYREMVDKTETEVMFSTTVTDIRQEGSLVKVTAGTPGGERVFLADAVILASGCRERSRGSLEIPGTRPAGVYSAGTAQALMNLRGLKVGEMIVIVGSGDIGLIMARRFTLEGSRVLGVIEKEEKPGGFARNIKECLEDFGIPLRTGSQVVEIEGRKRVEAVKVRDAAGREERLLCDTVILAAGLVPEDGMVSGTVPGLFYCGNVLYVHDLVDNVSVSGEEAAFAAAAYLLGRGDDDTPYSSENLLRTRDERRAFLRLKKKAGQEEDGDFVICTGCPNSCRISLKDFSGGKCDKGEAFARAEVENPKRVFTSTVRIEGGDRTISVRTEGPIPRALLKKASEAATGIIAPEDTRPGLILDENFLGTGERLIVTGE